MKCAVLIINDSRSFKKKEDIAGSLIIEFLKKLGEPILLHDSIVDDKVSIKKKLVEFCDQLHANLILTTGGTGLSERDVAPEATEEVLDRKVPGIAEYLRSAGYKKTEGAIFFRGVAGLRKKTLIINLPDSPKAVRYSLKLLKYILFHTSGIIDVKSHESLIGRSS